MRLISDGHDHRGEQGWRWYAGAAGAVAVAAVAGSTAVDPGSTWYRALRKPVWQPPSWAFGVVWTPLYACLAFAGGRALTRTHGRERVQIATSFGMNLTLNAGWNWLFFGLRNPRAGLAGTALLDLSNADLARRIARADKMAGRALWPYSAWCAFATALNASIAHHNR
ncbi:TspO/MBR family protein [Streptomyces sp. NPDC001443]